MIVALPDKWMRAGIISGALFLLLLVIVSLNIGFINSIDTNLTAAFANWHTGFGNVIVWIVQTLGDPNFNIIYAIILGIILWLSQLRIPAIWVIATLLSGDAITWLIKNIVHRARPLGQTSSSDGYSFPSGHVFSTAIIVTILFVIIIPNIVNVVVRRWVSFAAIVFTLLVMEARIYSGAHYLTDTLAGAALGFAWVVLFVFLYQKIAPQLTYRIALFADDTY